jgi:signal transduction histidine kinase/ActR/RegA family two-component response regulator/HPt (histidine-containing phosphotransfer) domain-containing protein
LRLPARSWKTFLPAACAALITALGSYVLAGLFLRSQIEPRLVSELSACRESLGSLLRANEDALSLAAAVMALASERGESQEERQNLLRSISRAYSGQKDLEGTFRSLYGFLEGSFIDGAGLASGTAFSPETSQWYRGALATRGFWHSAPKADSASGLGAATVSVEVRDSRGGRLGALALDYLFSPAAGRVAALARAGPGVAVLTDQSGTLLAGPDLRQLGKALKDDPGLSPFSPALAAARPDAVTSESIDILGQRHAACFTALDNGWRLALAVPEASLHGGAKDLLPGALGIALAAAALTSLLSLRLQGRESSSPRPEPKDSPLKPSFISRMSHKLRTPLNAIIGLSDLAEREYGSEDAKGYLGDIRKAGKDLLGIIKDIFEFSNIESGQFRVAYERYDAGKLVEDLISDCRALAREKGLEFVSDVDPFIPQGLVGDALSIQQVVLHLASNAVKFTGSGRVKLSLRWDRLDLRSVALFFTVEDTGTGLSEEELADLMARLDEPGSQARSAGAGLGLPIARSICRMMEGDVTARSVFGEGSSFTASFVQEAYDLTPIGKSRASGRSGPEDEEDFRTPFAAPACSVLVVDDNRASLTVAQGLLAAYGMQVETATGGEEAVEAAKGKSFDLILVDQLMPGLDGYAAMKLIRSLSDHYREAPVIAFTADALTGARERLISLGFTDYLSKPVEARDIAAILDKWLPEAAKIPFAEASAESLSVGAGEASVSSQSGGQPGTASGPAASLPDGQASSQSGQPGRPSGPPGDFSGVGLSPESASAAGLIHEAASEQARSARQAGSSASSFRLPAVLKGLDGYDPEAGLARCGGSPALYRRKLEIFLAELTGYLQYAESREGGDESGRLGLLEARVHAIKGALGDIGAFRLASDAAALEEAARSGNIGTFEDGRLDSFDVSLMALRDRITQALPIMGRGLFGS